MLFGASNMIKFVVVCVCLWTLFYGVFAEIVNAGPCEDIENQCVNQVKIEPCKDAARNLPCKVKKGTHASVEVEFTPDFDSDTLHSQPYWDNGFADLPLIGMDTDGCKYTECPLKKGKKQTYNYSLLISKDYPAATYSVKWKLTGSDSKQQCCFTFKIKITR